MVKGLEFRVMTVLPYDIWSTISKGLMYNLLQFDASIQGSSIWGPHGSGFRGGSGLGIRVFRDHKRARNVSAHFFQTSSAYHGLAGECFFKCGTFFWSPGKTGG